MTARAAHFEINGPDDDAVVAFCTALLGWPAEHRGPRFPLLQPGSGPAGAIVESSETRTVLGVTVGDLDAVRERVAGPAGQLVMHVTDNGWVTKALVSDRAGNVLSLIRDRDRGAVGR